MKTEVSPVLKVVLFLNNENIDIIPRIYQGKVEDHIIAHLLDSARYYRETITIPWRGLSSSVTWIVRIGKYWKITSSTDSHALAWA